MHPRHYVTAFWRCNLDAHIAPTTQPIVAVFCTLPPYPVLSTPVIPHCHRANICRSIRQHAMPHNGMDIRPDGPLWRVWMRNHQVYPHCTLYMPFHTHHTLHSQVSTGLTRYPRRYLRLCPVNATTWMDIHVCRHAVVFFHPPIQSHRYFFQSATFSVRGQQQSIGLIG